MDIQTEVIEYIKQHLEARSLSRLAREVGIQRAWFNKLLKGERGMTVETAQKILDHKHGRRREEHAA